MELSIIIPAYNEQDRIAPTLQSVHTYLSKRYGKFEILVVDDGSNDNTLSILNELKQCIPNVLVMSLAPNKGKGHAVRHGMLAATGKVRVFTDADGSTPIDEIDKLLQPLLSHEADIAIGSRYLGNSLVIKAQPKLRIVWSRMVNRFVQKKLLAGISDTHCGFKAFTAEAAEKIFSTCTIDGWSFDLEVLVIARRLQMTVVEVPVKWTNDERSKGKLRHLPGELYSFYKIKRQAHK